MNLYLEEAAVLAAEIPRNRCPATDAIEWLDAHPEYRLVLEDTWTDNAGRVYHQVPADVVSRWPAHLSRTFRSFLRISKDPDHVFRLLDLLHGLDAGPEVVRSTLAGCRRRKSLQPAIDYFTKLNDELSEVSRERPVEEVTLATLEPRCGPRVVGGEVEAGTWHLPNNPDEPEEEGHFPPCYRAELLHDPAASPGSNTDWLTRQPRALRKLYCVLKRAKSSALPRLRTRLLELSAPSSAHSKGHMQVLWDAYRVRRDHVRRSMQQRVSHDLGPTARALVKRIQRVHTTHDAAWVGMNLYRSMKGELRLPGPVSQPEWSVVFASYRARKSAVLSAR